MKMKIATTIAMLIAAHGMSNAATIQLSKGLSPGFNATDTAGALVATTVFIGTFANGTAPTIPGNGNYTSIISSFNIFGGGPGISIGSGSLITNATGITSTANPTLFNGFTLYAIIANSSTLSTATQFALVNNTGAGTFFPTDITTSNSASINFTTFTALQTVAGGGTTTTGTPNSIHMINVVTAVPETSTALLGAIGVLGLLRRRRN